MERIRVGLIGPRWNVCLSNFTFFFTYAIQTERVDEAGSERQESERRCSDFSSAVRAPAPPYSAFLRSWYGSVLGDPIAVGHATCVLYLCSRDRPKHLNRPFECEYASETGVARGIVPPSLTLERARAIDDQVVRQVSVISTEGANLTFSDDYENGGLRHWSSYSQDICCTEVKAPHEIIYCKKKKTRDFFQVKYLCMFIICVLFINAYIIKIVIH